MQAELIVIGDELLIGQILDTNTRWITSRLTEIGVQVRQVSTVPDQESPIIEALQTFSSRSDIVFVTGGLGPTKDDITKHTLATYFNCGFTRNQEVFAYVNNLFADREQAVREANYTQADVLEIAEVLLNKAGTAPGMWIPYGGKYYVIMPGVPSEMKYLMEHEVLPRIKNLPGRINLVHEVILTAGIGESSLAAKIASIENCLPSYIKLAYLPSYSQVVLRLSGQGTESDSLRQEVRAFSKQIKDCISDHFINDNQQTLQETVLLYLKALNLTLGLAESCTGGYISHLITQVPGCSSVFLGGITSYSNKSKIDLLHVDKSITEQFGAVSEETALAMAAGVKKVLGTSYSISATGIAGPDGGSIEKPVGTVWLAVSGLSKTVTRKYVFGKSREENIIRASMNALILLHQLIKEESAEGSDIFSC